MTPIRNQSDIDTGLKNLLATDPDLRQLAKQVGSLPLRLQPSGFAGMVRIIIGQQVSRASAEAITERLFSLVSPLTPDTFISAGADIWSKAGLSRPKQKTLSNLALAVISGELDLDALGDMPATQAVKTLTAQHGIGPWTAEVYMMFCLGHPDMFPARDLALQEALRVYLKLEKRPGETQTIELTEKWSPYKSIAARLFWAYYAILKQGKGALPV